MSDRAWPETTLDPRIHCRGTHRQEWLAPIRLAGRPAIADVRHVRNGTGQYCTLRGYGQGQPHLPAASGNRDVKPGRWYSRRPHRLHHPALRPCDISAAPAEGPCPAHRGIRRRRSRFVLAPERSHCSTALAEGPRPFHSPGAVGNTRIDSIAADRATGSPVPVQYVFCPANASPANSNWHMTLPPLPVFRHGCPSEAGSQQHDNASNLEHSCAPEAIPSRLQAT